MGVEQDMSETLLRFYEAAASGGDWTPALESLNELFNASGATVHRIAHGNPPSLGYWGAGIDVGVEEAYQRDFAAMDPRVAAAVRVTEGMVVTDWDLVPAGTMTMHPFYNEFLRPNGYGLFLCSLAIQRPGLTVGVSLQLSGKIGEPSVGQINLLRAMTPHVRQAMLVRHEFESAAARKAAQSTALDLFRTPTFLTGPHLQLEWANQAGELALSRGDPLACRGRTIFARHSADQDSLARAVHTAAGGKMVDPTPLEIVLRRTGNLRPVRALVAPVSESSTHVVPNGGAILILCIPETVHPADGMLRALYGLTAAEDKLAAHLASGGSLEEFCGFHAITGNTARTHLKRIFMKTGTSRQGELVALVSRHLGNAHW